MKKITIIILVLILSLPVLLKAQYGGGNGRGDVSVNLPNIALSFQEVASELPATYFLKQNYPNPFNPTTVIRFGIPSLEGYAQRGVGMVTLKIYDITGRELQTLINERLQPGTYETTFDGTAYTSGIYFYRLQTENYSETKKLILLK